jgi:hypothetical protein
MIFKIFSHKNLAKKLAFLLKLLLLVLVTNNNHNISIGEKRQFFRRKLAKIEENCEHNIDPWNLKLKIFTMI